MLSYYYFARPMAVIRAAIMAGPIALSVASLSAAETPPVNKVLTTISGFNSPVGITVSPDSEFVYVVNNGNNTVSVIDAASNQIATTLTSVGQQPYELALSADGRKLLVSDDARSGNEGNCGTVTTVDTKTAASTSVNTNGLLYEGGPTFTPDGKHVWIAEWGGANGGVIDILDVATGKLSPYPIYLSDYAIDGAATAAWYVAFTPTGNKAYITDLYSKVWVFNAETAKYETQIKSNGPAAGLCITPDGKKVYVLNQNIVSSPVARVSVISTATNKVVTQLNLKVASGQSVGARPALTPDGNYLYVPVQSLGSGSLLMVSTKTDKVVGDPVPLNAGSSLEVAIAPNGKTAYVTNESASTVTVIGISE